MILLYILISLSFLALGIALKVFLGSLAAGILSPDGAALAFALPISVYAHCETQDAGMCWVGRRLFFPGPYLHRFLTGEFPTTNSFGDGLIAFILVAGPMLFVFGAYSLFILQLTEIEPKVMGVVNFFLCVVFGSWAIHYCLNAWFTKYDWQWFTHQNKVLWGVAILLGLFSWGFRMEKAEKRRKVNPDVVVSPAPPTPRTP